MNYTELYGCSCPTGNPPCRFCTDTFECDICGDRHYSTGGTETEKGFLCEICLQTHEYEKAAKDFKERSRTELADKILSRLAVIFTDYKNAGFENSAQVTKYIMNEIEEIVKS